MENAKRLNRAFIDRHAACHVVITDVCVLNAHVADCRVSTGFRHVLKIRFNRPDCHADRTL
jgi:hypothetical protein